MPQSDKELLQRLPGVGEKKSERLVDEFGESSLGTPRAITTSSTGRFEEIEGFTQESGSLLQSDMRRFDIDQGLFDEDPRERDAETKGEFSQAVTTNMPGAEVAPGTGALTEVQDTDFTRQERNRAEKFHQARSERAQAIDESLRAPIADSFDQWRNDKNDFDFPGIDTPKF